MEYIKNTWNTPPLPWYRRAIFLHLALNTLHFIISPSFTIPHYYFLSTCYFSLLLPSNFIYNLSCTLPFHCFVFVLTTFILLVHFCHVAHFFSFTIKAHVFFMCFMLLISGRRAFSRIVEKLLFYILDSV